MEKLGGENVHNLESSVRFKGQKAMMENTHIDKYYIGSVLNSGAYGCVYQGMNNDTKQEVAVKVLNLEEEQSEAKRKILDRLIKTEPLLMMLFNCDNIVKCYDIYENTYVKIFMIEYCNGSDLKKLLDQRGHFEEAEAKAIIIQILNGLKEMHSKKIIHRDLKCENIMSHNGVFKIGDFGFSKQLNVRKESERHKGTLLGSLPYCAPEVLNKEQYGLRADIWSVGIIFFALIFGDMPFYGSNQKEMYTAITESKVLAADQITFNGKTASREASDFLKRVLVTDQSHRMGWNEINQHKLFSSGQESERLPQHFMMRFTLNPQQMPSSENLVTDSEYLARAEQNINPEDSNPSKESVKITEVPQAIGKKKMEEIETIDEELFKWVNLNHVECLKTECIYDNIIIPLLKDSLLDQEDRMVIEFMYLLLARCFNNMSLIKDKLIKHEKSIHLLKLQDLVSTVYKKVKGSFQDYSKQLTKQEDKILSIIQDRFSSIFSSKEQQQKNIYLTGIQGKDYTKKQQIEFTLSEYIKPQVIPLLRKCPLNNTGPILRYLQNYERICLVTPSEFKGTNFETYVNKIMDSVALP